MNLDSNFLHCRKLNYSWIENLNRIPHSLTLTEEQEGVHFKGTPKGLPSE